MTGQNILQMQNIHKAFGGVIALDNVSFNVKKGSVHALMGENGAGKSTLMKILLGINKPDQGTICIDNKEVTWDKPSDALAAGISMIHQELNPVPHLSIAENIFLGREPINKRTGFIDYKRMNEETSHLLKELDLQVAPTELVANLSVAKIQLIEIAKAISYQAQIVVMDEPTSAISNKEVDKLFQIIQKLKTNGVTVIYISHKMEEVFSICDDVTVLRDGSFIGTESIREINMNQLVSMMVGRKIEDVFPQVTHNTGEVILKANNLESKGLFQNISFQLKKGEILGFAGLMGAGRTEIMEAIFGLRKLDKGELIYKGKKVIFKHPQDAVKNKIILVPEDRKNSGLVLNHSIRQNISLTTIGNYTQKGLIKAKKERSVVERIIEKLRIKVSNMEQSASSLSGGNQQKVVLAKCLLSDPEIIILDEPTRGIDIKAKSEIYKIINELAQQGKGIIMISSEMPEILGLSDRILVLHQGQITGELLKKDATQEKILQLAMGRNVS
ncbi:MULTISPECIES: sugar ABC transporter ATP-binding protein [Bacillaceae]|uniref:sugar ABC transporter ATP-binding protein n=1 Tax=Bacillaceae TaxID=186817 RepID=UPI000BA69108|nr:MULTISPECIES: sugar ABC transporter ATP-binding protein [Bacillaceae]MCM3704662.1 sugar ABC transporter ATP-binding protein [Cytobacillus firmus]PAE23860.1 D-xylose ABC transporter ATP-binding protein [Bacillus sp. 7894-2]URM34800.1 sugar ABC transporter ATP-binding protein [Cytobacillus firmus]